MALTASELYRGARSLNENLGVPYGLMAAVAAQYGWNYARNLYRRNKLYFQAAKGAFASLKKNKNKSGMPPTTPRKRQRTAMPATPRSRSRSQSSSMSPVRRGRSKTRTTSKNRSSSAVTVVAKRRNNNSRRKQSPVKARNTMTFDGKSSGIILATRKTKKAKTRIFDLLGATYTAEYSSTVSKVEVASLGHANLPQQPTLRTLWLAILKKLFVYVGVAPNSFAASIPFLSIGDSVVVLYKQRPDLSTFSSAVSTLSGTENISYFATNLVTTWDSQSPSTIIEEIQFVPAAGSKLKFTRMNLSNARVVLKAHSQMRIQNRSLTAEGSTTMDSVSAAPIVGKVYEGFGNGTLVKDDSTTLNSPPFYANNEGVMIPAMVFNSTNEPPPAHIFTNVNKYGNIKFEAGEARTHNLNNYFTIRFTKLYQLLNGNNTADLYSETKLGKFGFVIVEKFIDNAGENNQVKLGFDIQHTISMYIKPGYLNITCPLVEDELV